jgi:hypothetical protein
MRTRRRWKTLNNWNHPKLTEKSRSCQAWWQHSAGSYPNWVNVVCPSTSYYTKQMDSSGMIKRHQFHWAQPISKVPSNTGSTKTQWRTAIIRCSHQHSCQHRYHRWTVWSHDRSQATAHVLYQRDPEGCSNKVPSSPKAALCSPYDDQEGQALLLGIHCSSRIRSTIGAHPPKQGSNRADHIMGGGDRPVWC